MIHSHTYKKLGLAISTALILTACGGSSTPAETTDPDTTAPVITITGGNTATVVQNATYTDAGAIATDNVDGTVNVTSTGTVDTSTVGDYTITYTATDSAGNSATAIRTVTVTDSSISITHNGTTYGFVTSPYTGKVWLDRNLGAAQVCESFDDDACYGDHYQWGRDFDGHQDSLSATTSTQATNVNNAGSSFITGSSDWTSVDAGTIRRANWSATDGSSVCPNGFRVPTLAELRAETLDVDVTNAATAFSNFLKLPAAGYRDHFDGSMIDVGSWGDVWSSSVDGSDSQDVGFDSGYARTDGAFRADGLSVRCLRD